MKISHSIADIMLNDYTCLKISCLFVNYSLLAAM